MLVTGFRPGERAPFAPRFIGELSSRRLDGIAEYEAGAAAGDLTVEFLNAHPGGGLYETDVYMEREAHAAHPYIKWNRHYLGNSHWIARFEAKNGAVFGASLHPSSREEPHAESERRNFRALFEHMSRAWTLATRPADLSSHHEAIVVVNCAGRAVAMSPAATALVDAEDGVLTHRGELLPTDRRMWSRWRDAVQCVALRRWRDDEVMLLPRQQGAKSLLITIGATPLQPGFGSYSRDVLVRIIDRHAVTPDLTETSMRLWGLTPAEARLLQTLVQNDFALRDAADRLGVTYATVRTQIASVFAKTDTGGQPELMRLATRLSS